MNTYTLPIYPNAGYRIHWGLLRDALGQLDIGDKLILVTSDWPIVNSARKAVYNFAWQHGFSFATAKEGTKTLVIERTE